MFPNKSYKYRYKFVTKKKKIKYFTQKHDLSKKRYGQIYHRGSVMYARNTEIENVYFKDSKHATNSCVGLTCTDKS